MPIARIRTFDPEAVSFLASKLAASGYQLQFATPNDTDLEEADLEITVTRMDSGTALEQARLQAEQMDADVFVMPGVFIAPEPEVQATPAVSVMPSQEWEVLPEGQPSREPVLSSEETIAAPLHTTAPWTTPYHADIPESSNEFIHDSQLDEYEPVEPSPSRAQEAANAIANEVRHGAEALGSFAHSSAERIRDWSRRSAEARALRRAEREQELMAAKEDQKRQESLAIEAEQRRQQSLREVQPPPAVVNPFVEATSRPKLVSSAPAQSRTIHARDRRYQQAAIAAALVIAGAMIGWSLAGFGGPANPIGKSGIANVQQQTPFGAASLNAPAQVVAPVAQPVAAKPSVRHVRSSKPTHRTRASRTATAHRARVRAASTGDDQEVVVRHFGAKPAEQQAKAKTKDGVKVITEE
jgi:hypothetical protein